MTSIQTPQDPDPTQQLFAQTYYHLIHTLCALLPPPLIDTPDALLARNDAAIAKVAALAPVNADEADIAAHCVAARAQAEDVLRLTRRHAGDILLLMKLNNQYALMERTAVSVRNQLQRVQTARDKREKSSGAANSDEWTRHIATRLMQRALERAPPSQVPIAEQSGPALSGEPPAAPLAMPAAGEPPAEPTLAPAAQVPVAAPSPSAPAPVAAPPRRQRACTAAEADEPTRDLAAEAEYYAHVYPQRARSIRQHGGLPPDCSFGPPDDDLVHAIVTGTSPVLRALDDPVAAVA
ncbi:MAG TPA: hypothetical protein VND19_18775 [Acetobacteraceae bacterium]|nr:hypothetical protein [Acetobacteraceae bacterium]